MAQLPKLKSFIVQDYPEDYADLMQKLTYTLNQFTEPVYYALSNNLTFSENLAAITKTISFTAPISSDGILIPNTFGVPCRGSIVLDVQNTSTSNAVLSAAPFVQFVNTGTNIKVKAITGLTAGQTYNVTIVFLKGP